MSSALTLISPVPTFPPASLQCTCSVHMCGTQTSQKKHPFQAVLDVKLSPFKLLKYSALAMATFTAVAVVGASAVIGGRAAINTARDLNLINDPRPVGYAVRCDVEGYRDERFDCGIHVKKPETEAEALACIGNSHRKIKVCAEGAECETKNKLETCPTFEVTSYKIDGYMRCVRLSGEKENCGFYTY